MFPLVILAQKNTAATHNHTPIIQKLQEKFTKARQSGNPMEGNFCYVSLKLQFKSSNSSFSYLLLILFILLLF